MIKACFNSVDLAFYHRSQKGGWLYIPDDSTEIWWFCATYYTPSIILNLPEIRASKGGTLE